ncbi:Mercuric resistance operon regulatory protein [bacterium HR29]|nr:Mercuric resistance operon regulatory protein [bacterium HR29]
MQEAARACGLSADTIRYYERVGVLPRAPRAPSGYRVYSQEHVEVLRFVRRLRDLGLPLDAIRQLAHLVHDASCGALREELLGRLHEARAQLAIRRRELERMDEQLSLLEADIRELPPGETRLRASAPCPCLRAVEGGWASP